MKKIFLSLVLSIISFHSFSQEEVKEKVSSIPFCNCGCFKRITGLVDFYGSQDPQINYACSDFQDVTIVKTQGFTGVYELSVTGFSFDPDRTWVYFQSETSLWREVQAQVQPNGVIFIQANQNGTLTNILTQNVSFEIRTF